MTSDSRWFRLSAFLLVPLGIVVIWVIGTVLVPWSTVHFKVGRIVNGGDAAEIVQELGGASDAARKLSAYLRLPRWMASRRRAAVECLGECGATGVDALEAAATDINESEDVRLDAVSRLGDTRDRHAIEALGVALSDESRRIRMEAAASLAGLRNPEASRMLVNALEDECPDVRKLSVRALRYATKAIRDKQVGSKLKDVSAEVRAEALAVVGYARLSALLGAVTDLLKEDSSPEVRRSAARALGKMRDPRGSPSLIMALQDSSPLVRVEAGAALGRCGGQEAGSALLAHLADSSPQVRREFVAALGRLRHVPAASQIEDIMKQDGDDSVRDEAAWALGRIGLSSSKTALTMALKDTSVHVRQAAREALEKIKKAQEEKKGVVEPKGKSD